MEGESRQRRVAEEKPSTPIRTFDDVLLGLLHDLDIGHHHEEGVGQVSEDEKSRRREDRLEREGWSAILRRRRFGRSPAAFCRLADVTKSFKVL